MKVGWFALGLLFVVLLAVVPNYHAQQHSSAYDPYRFPMMSARAPNFVEIGPKSVASD